MHVPSIRTKVLLAVRGLINATALFLLFLAWDRWITLADTIAIFVAVVTVSTTSCARITLGDNERVSWLTIIGGTLTLLGAAFVIQPSWLFPVAATQAGCHPIGVVLSSVAGVCCTVFNLLTRYLGEGVSPATFLAYEASAQGVFGLTLALLSAAVCLALHRPQPLWLMITFPSGARIWMLALVYGCLVTGGQLSLAIGFSAVPAGKAAILTVEGFMRQL